MYELVCGSIFDTKCDILVIPCDHFGGITRSVSEHLIANDLPKVPTAEYPGEIKFKANNESFTNALVLGFAASVNALNNKCSLEYLHNICKELKIYCLQNSLPLINIPLLGAGAGGLSAQESYETLKSYFEEESGITLKIFVLSRNVYQSLLEESREENLIKNPRVFVSYTGENSENGIWVKEFVCKLRNNGVNARMDLFHLKPGQDLPQWMTNELIMADKVLLICDKFYAGKADSRNGGVGWETMIIQGDMMANNQTGKYICIVREESIDKGIPIYMKSKFSLHWTKPGIPDEQFKELLFYLFDCDMEPPMGRIPSIIYDKKKEK